MENNYEEYLKKTVNGYDGVHKEIINLAPELYDLGTKLLFDKDLEQIHRTKLLASIGYFILPNDLYPEDEFGPIGYVDDLILLLTVLRQVNEEYSISKLNLYWKGSGIELQKCMDEYYKSLLNDFPDLYNELIEFAGF